MSTELNKIFLFLLINVHIIACIVLFYLIVKQSIKFFVAQKKRKPGSLFKRNLLFLFITFATVPTAFVCFTAGRLIKTNIDSWFKRRIGTGLHSGLAVHELHTQKERLAIQEAGDLCVKNLPEVPGGIEWEKLIKERLPNTPCFTPYSFNIKHRNITGSILNEFPIWRKFRKINDRSIKSLKRYFFSIIQKHEGCEHVFDFFGSLYWSKKIKTLNGQTSYLILAHRYPKEIRKPLLELQKSLIDYELLRAMKDPIYWNYLATFLLFTLLVIFLSIWCAFYLSKGISKPIQLLLEATAKIKKGSWNISIPETASGDLQPLLVGFNGMAKNLQLMYNRLEQKNDELSTILETIRESVFFVNKWGRVLMYNASAKKLVKQYLKISRFKNQKINIFGKIVTENFFSFVRKLKKEPLQTLSQEISFSNENGERSFVVHLSVLKQPSEQGLLVIIEDLTEVLKVSRIKTWQEAAQQIAHEIKNPLTPIQLATQRLKRKFHAHKDVGQIITECTETILNQVSTIKDLVSHFSEFAKMPEVKIEQIDLNQLVERIVTLYRMSYQQVSFSCSLESFLPLLKFDRKKLERVLVNLLDNSVRALKKAEKPSIEIKTTFKTKQNHLEFVISDNGPGIPKEVKDKLFLPYISTSSKNMGLGLAIVHEIISQAGGSIRLVPTERGTIFQITIPL
jgi:two-component system, NtrC family, nitrogen regulation sensor histidine kinase NtrY